MGPLACALAASGTHRSSTIRKFNFLLLVAIGDLSFSRAAVKFDRHETAMAGRGSHRGLALPHAVQGGVFYMENIELV
jgi:ABC-type arginine transport system ATPase subunit